MRRLIGVGAVVVMALLLAPVMVSAQSIGGTVTDETGGVLPGVTVEARSPALIEQVRTVVTDGAGEYQIEALVSGVFSVTFTLPGFSTVVHEGIELAGDFNANVDAQMQVGAVEETITVSGESPVVDIQNVAQQTVISREVLDSVPSGRQFQNLAVLTPGMTSGTVRASVKQDVGGQSGQIHMALGIHGGDPRDQHIVVDGMSQSAWNEQSNSAIWFSDGAFEEYSIDHSANGAEIETGGVRMNLIPREGGNTFSSRTFVNFSHQDWQRDNLTDELIDRGLDSVNSVKELWQFNPSVGGPIMRDRLWFFTSYTKIRTDSFVAGTFEAIDPTSPVHVPDLTRQALDDQYNDDFTLRLTWQPTPRNKIRAYYNDNSNSHRHFLVGAGAIAIPVKPSSSVLARWDNHSYQATWTAPLTSRLLLEAGVSHFPGRQIWRNQPEVAGSNAQVGILEVGSGLAAIRNMSAWLTRSNWDISNSNDVYRGSVSYVTGSHSVKVGTTVQLGTARNFSTSTPEPYRFRTRFGLPLQVEFSAFPVLDISHVRPNLGFYAQDQWRVDRLTINAGLRFDYFRTGYPDHNNPPTELVAVPRIFPGQTVVTWKDWNPRLGLVYDLFGDGRTALKVTANRYVDRNGMQLAYGINPARQNNTSGFIFWRDFNGDFVPDCDGTNPRPNGECLQSAPNADFGRPIINTFYDEDWAFGTGTRAANWEFSGSLQHELRPGMSVNFAYFRRVFVNFSARDNRAVGPSDYDQYCVTVPLDSRLPGGGGNQICGLFDLNPAKVGQIDRITTSANNFGDRIQHWNGFDATVNARMDNGLLLQGGWSAGRTLTDDCDIRANLDNPSQHHCRVETPFITDVKFLGSYTLPYDIQIAATFQSIQGPQLLAEVNYSRDEIAASLGRFPTSSASDDIQVIPPGTEYGERLNQVDLRFTKIFTFGPARVQAMVDFYNLFNNSSELVLNDGYGAASLGGPNWPLLGAVVPGTLLKFGFQVDF